MKTLEQLLAELTTVKTRCEQLARKTHSVGNCPSDLEHLDAAWRQRQRLEYQINQMEKMK
jgi:hypothetical protein